MRKRLSVGFKTIGVGILIGAVVLASQAAQAVHGAQNAPTIQRVLQAHRAWRTLPEAIEIVGMSTKGKESDHVRITATAKEETAMEYGLVRDKKNVMTSSEVSRDDGKKVQRSSTSTGFSQLDVTGIYLVAHAAPAAVAKAAESAEFLGNKVQRIAVRRNRTEKRVGYPPVEDQFDAYIGESGLLAGVGRSLYPKTSPLHYTIAYGFSDYRETRGVILPYRITVHLKGKLVETIDVSAYNFDFAPDSILFKARSTR